MGMGLGGWARRSQLGRNGFGALFANLFAGLRSVLVSNSELPKSDGRQRRKAG